MRLEPFTPSIAEAIVSGVREGQEWSPGFPREDDQDVARMFLSNPTTNYLIVVDGMAVGTIGYFGPPDADGQIMIGYGLAPEAHGFGYATAAVKALIADAVGIKRIVADIDLDNIASQRVLEKAGFEHTHSTETSHWYAWKA